jgi:hypothetical protein
MKKRVIEMPAKFGKDLSRYAEKGYIIRNLFGFLVVVALLLITLTSQS